MKPAQLPIQHRDQFGRNVTIGDTVVYCQSNCLHVGTIRKLTARRVHITRLGAWNWTSQQRPETFILLADPAVTTWLLRGAKNKWSIMYPA